ncbi:hypothetical protein [Luteimonas sp. R10]|uniref:hypothetical protein n=1 Tax=Luteimonas sp. R10 TaxID=3108176 RepID=UPI00308B17BA|nr:hypothetical protein U3649_00690 [Luteimonas sp. R10]
MARKAACGPPFCRSASSCEAEGTEPAAEIEAGKLVWPVDLDALAGTPDWAKPLLEAALSMGE